MDAWVFVLWTGRLRTREKVMSKMDKLILRFRHLSAQTTPHIKETCHWLLIENWNQEPEGEFRQTKVACSSPMFTSSGKANFRSKRTTKSSTALQLSIWFTLAAGWRCNIYWKMSTTSAWFASGRFFNKCTRGWFVCLSCLSLLLSVNLHCIFSILTIIIARVEDEPWDILWLNAILKHHFLQKNLFAMHSTTFHRSIDCVVSFGSKVFLSSCCALLIFWTSVPSAMSPKKNEKKTKSQTEVSS